MLEHGDVTGGTSPSVLVVGGGLAGMQASLLLAAAGVRVHLVDRAPAIGGHQPLLDKTFPTDSCGLCFMSPRPAAYCPFVECERNPYIAILPSTEVLELSGQAGDFSVRLLRRARGVDTGRCTGCGGCSAACPVAVRSEFGGGLEERKAIYRPFPQAVPDSYLVDWAHCTRCGECAKVCPTGALDLGQQDAQETVQAGAVIVATGFQPVEGGLKTEYGHGLFPNVLTSIQLERMLSRSGPTRGEILRPSDGAAPRRVAFLQCVGSRDPSCGRSYCSSICCMYAAKQAGLIRQRTPDASVVVFQMDMRSAGKGYDRYVARVRSERGVEYRRSAVSTVKQIPGSRDLRLSFVDPEGVQREEVFSLVVLSVGVEPSEGVRALAERLGLPLNRHGFLESGELFRQETPVAGIFVAGGGREPMDVAEAVADGAAAAASALGVLGVGVLSKGSPHPDPLPWGEGDREPPLPRGEGRGEGRPAATPQAEAPRVGVLLCNCGGEIGAHIDLPGLAQRALTWPQVGYAAVVDGLCRSRRGGSLLGVSPHPVDLPSGRSTPLPRGEGETPRGEGDVRPLRTAVDQGANRLVVAACARRKIEDLIGAGVAEAGLAPGLVEMANLREQCVWVHAEAATREAKAEGLLRMAVAAAALAEPVEPRSSPLPPTALVVGGGAAGMVAALTLAEQGVEVWLAERESELGGDLGDAGPMDRRTDILAALQGRIEGLDRIHVLTDAEVVGVEGRLGSFRGRVRLQERQETISSSVVLLASGVSQVQREEYLRGQHPAVLTLAELARRLGEDGGWARRNPRVALLLCAGSLEEGQGYCSRTCCSEALALALDLKQANPEAELFVLYRELRSLGFAEESYEAARRAGVLFLRYEAGQKPVVTPRGGELRIEVWEPHLGRPVSLEVDALALALGVRPRPVEGLAQSLGVELDEDGFFSEANGKTRSTEAGRPGVFLCGSAQSPRSLSDTVTHAKAAALRALALLRPGRVVAPVTLPSVNERICSGCGLCVESCAYGARVLDRGKNVSTLVEVLCQGCGACAAVCPNGATQQQGFTGKQMVAVLDAAID